MIERLVLAGIIILAGAGLYWLARGRHLQGLRRRLRAPAPGGAPGLAAFEPGRPALLYFTTDSCVPCRTVLKPALQRLHNERDSHFQLVEVNAERQPEAARYWKVLSVPTIFVLDPQGRPQHVHYGVTNPAVLQKELHEWSV
jgi:thiol-disulfide isomerase/thioredoxin